MEAIDSYKPELCLTSLDIPLHNILLIHVCSDHSPKVYQKEQYSADTSLSTVVVSLFARVCSSYTGFWFLQMLAVQSLMLRQPDLTTSM